MKRYFGLIFILLLFVACSKKPKEEVILRVGDREITTKEFQYRAEFTPHPNFPRHNHTLENIFLNNLVMEKIFAMEAGKNSELAQSERFQAHIQGIQEQEMRKQLFIEEHFKTVELDSTQIAKAYRLSQREYDIEFYTIHNETIAEKLQAEILAFPDSAHVIFDSVFRTAHHPRQTVKYRDQDHLSIHEALFTDFLPDNQVIGPLRLGKDEWIIMKVADWKDVLILGGEEQQLRVQQVVEKLTLNKATRSWDAMIRNLMKGKSIQFDKEMFIKIADLTFELESAAGDEEKEAIMKQFYQDGDSTLTIADLPSMEELESQPFFEIDGITWTVGDFRKELASHPLVYRAEASTRGAFYNEFRAAIADLVRDHYLNESAYDKGIDKHPEVKRVKTMWKDAMLGTWYRDQLLKQVAAGKDTSRSGHQFYLGQEFEAEMTKLREKYLDDIEVNYPAFKNIEISAANLVVMQQQVPYPIAVPAWPNFTNHRESNFKGMKLD